LLPERYGEEEFRGEFSRLVGMEVRRLNGVLEMLLDYGQLGTPRPVDVDLSKWVTNYCDEKRLSSVQKIPVTLENPLPLVRFDDRHLNFVFERIFEQIQAKGIAGREIRIMKEEVTQGENWEKLDICYEEEKAFIQPSSRKITSAGNRDFEGLSLGLVLARRIMRKSNGEMSVIQDEGGNTQIFLQFHGQTPR